jgi:hypothetical protein
MRQFSALFVALTLLASLGCSAGPAPAGDSQAAEWIQLRQQRGHFDGAAWNKDLDAWQGHKHQLLQSLAERLLAEQPDQAGVRTLMGEPDGRVGADGAEYADWLRRTEWRGEPGEQLWSYHWRGNHDQLLVAFSGARVSAVGWLYAWE